MTDSAASTVTGVRDVGPRPASPAPSPLDRYPNDTTVAVCLAPVPGRELDEAVAVVSADDRT